MDDATTDEEDEIIVENFIEVNGETSQARTEASAPSQQRPRPRPAFKTRTFAQSQNEPEASQLEEIEGDDEIDRRLSEALSTPPPEANGRSQSVDSMASEGRLTTPEVESQSINGLPSKKRARITVEDEDEGANGTASSAAVTAAVTDEIVVRRKRVRR